MVNQPPKPAGEPSVPATATCSPQDGTPSGSPSQLGAYRSLCKGCRGTIEGTVFLIKCLHCAGNRSAGKAAGWSLPLPWIPSKSTRQLETSREVPVSASEGMKESFVRFGKHCLALQVEARRWARILLLSMPR